MAVSEVSGASYLDNTVNRTPKKELGKDEFLALLMTQMKYQDPLNPMDNNQYITQMAQLTSLEQMTNMAKSYEATRAFSLAGKTVTVTRTDSETGETSDVTGKVDKVIKEGGEYYLMVGDESFKLDDVKEVMGDNVGANENNT